MNISISSRSTAMAVTLVAARMGAIVGNLVFGYLVESHCATPILMVAGLLFGEPPRIISFYDNSCLIFSGGGMLGLLLPNTTKKPLM